MHITVLDESMVQPVVDRKAALEAELQEINDAERAQTRAAANARALVLQPVAADLFDGIEFHDSFNGKAWNGASFQTGEVRLPGGRVVTLQVTATDVVETKAMKEARRKSA